MVEVFSCTLIVMAYFLLKTESSSYSIDDLKRDKKTSWGGVRNYQARNFIRDMKVGDVCLLYHSSCTTPALVGEARIIKAAYPDPLQFEKTSDYYDAGSSPATPRWSAVDIAFTKKYKTPITLEHLRELPALQDMRLLARGNRLSVFPVEAKHISLLKKYTG